MSKGELWRHNLLYSLLLWTALDSESLTLLEQLIRRILAFCYALLGPASPMTDRSTVRSNQVPFTRLVSHHLLCIVLDLHHFCLRRRLLNCSLWLLFLRWDDVRLG